MLDVACRLKGAPFFFLPLCLLMPWTCKSGSIPCLGKASACVPENSSCCALAFCSLCQDLGSSTRAGDGIGGPVRPAAFEYLGGRHVIMFGAANDFWKSGNLGRQPETRKGTKLGGCLRKQGVGRINQHTKSWFVGHERRAVARHAAPHTPGCVGAPFLHQPPRGETP